MANKGKVLSDHVHPRNKNQQGMVYIRIPDWWLDYTNGDMIERISSYCTSEWCDETFDGPWYPDTEDSQRVISSQRVEDAVEIADFLARCKQRGWCVSYVGTESWWFVTNFGAKTLREAYFRAVAYDKDLQQARQDKELFFRVAEV